VKLAEIGAFRVKEAARLYLEVAFEGERGPAVPILLLKDDAPMETVLSLFVDESHQGGLRATHRHIVRLGSRLYPFMKFVLQEYLFEGEFFFCVDTHDQMELKPNVPDYDAWLELKRVNGQIKSEIERRWQQANLPTLLDMTRFVSTIQCVEPAPGESHTILIVDDEKPIADTISTLLRARGYRTAIAYDGHEALEKLADVRPNLVLTDYEMPGMDGVALAARIKSREDTRDIRVLLATAASMNLADIAMADGFLVKPFRIDILFPLIAHLLPR
jgi:CheY-like chemotaxis protein